MYKLNLQKVIRYNNEYIKYFLYLVLYFPFRCSFRSFPIYLLIVFYLLLPPFVILVSASCARIICISTANLIKWVRMFLPSFYPFLFSLSLSFYLFFAIPNCNIGHVQLYIFSGVFAHHDNRRQSKRRRSRRMSGVKSSLERSTFNFVGFLLRSSISSMCLYTYRPLFLTRHTL